MSGGSHFLRGGFFSGSNWFNPPCGNFCRRENILQYPARRSRGIQKEAVVLLHEGKVTLDNVVEAGGDLAVCD
jgi:hypothetical protein